jgi:tRNA(Ile)-lysidine synthase
VTLPSLSFARRFLSAAGALDLDLERSGLKVVVALSGGLDSVVLLHLLRFAPASGLHLTAAHFDHRMREGSARDARWVTGLCRAWRVPLILGRADPPPRSEDDARRARYRFLHQVRREAGADLLATAHHADDQAETVLFRVLRGTGLPGIAGIPPRSGHLVRPLLEFWRPELRAYACGVGLRWREDPTNVALHAARNRIRRELLPYAERHVAPGARRSLARLADLAREEEQAWRAVLDPLVKGLVEVRAEDLLLARKPLQTYHSALAARVVRQVLRRFGIVPSRAGTRAALQFITGAESGRRMELAGGLLLRAESEVVRIQRSAATSEADRPLVLALGASGGSGELVVGGKRFLARWRIGTWTDLDRQELDREEEVMAFRMDELQEPLVLRGRQAGDRIRLAGGSRSLKRLLIDRRVPAAERSRIPVLVSDESRILWARGVASAEGTSPRRGDVSLILSLVDARS